MSSTIATQTQMRPGRGAAPRGRRTNRGGKFKRGGGPDAGKAVPDVKDNEKTEQVVEKSIDISKAETEAAAAAAVDDTDVCWICAEPVKYYSVSQCNHRTCHVCALRLRALYKKLECTFCKEAQPSVAFTSSPDAPFTDLTAEPAIFKDDKLEITFETQEMMEETLILLRFNCPDPQCDYIAKGWADLKLHTRATHNKLMCDLCIKFKKVFAHEHALYTYPQLLVHLPSMNTRQHHKAPPKDQIDGSNHPYCEFCRECFFGDDELYAHMRHSHEECFVCKRNEIQHQYFHNYESLDRHFNTAHHPCTNPNCLARKFVVFSSPLDLKAHMVEEHGAEMSSRDMKDARRVQAAFEFEEVGGRARRRDREPPPHQQARPAPPPVPGSSRPPGGGRRREGFGGGLTTGDGSSGPATPAAGPSRGASPSPPQSDVDLAVLERHNAFLARLSKYSPNPTAAVPAVKAAIRGYRASETSARDLISTIWNVLDCHLEHTASTVNAFVDLLDEEDKKQDLLSSWRTFDTEQRRQFPDLVPTTVGSGYAGITSGRVLNAKHSTASRSSQSRQVWDRVARAASSSTASSSAGPSSRPPDNFPVLRTNTHAPSLAAPASTPAPQGQTFRPNNSGQRKTPWSASAAAAAGRAPPAASSPSSSRPAPRKAPPSLSKSLFPELPSSSANARSKPVINGTSSLKNILGTSVPPPAGAVWGSGSASGSSTPATGEVGGGEVPDAGASAPKGKKGKAKQKQTLFTLGSFPVIG